MPGLRKDKRTPYNHGLVPSGYDNMGPWNEVAIGPAGRNEADVLSRDHDIAYGEEEAIGVNPMLNWVDADEEYLANLNPTNWKEKTAQLVFSTKKALKNAGVIGDKGGMRGKKRAGDDLPLRESVFNEGEARQEARNARTRQRRDNERTRDEAWDGIGEHLRQMRLQKAMEEHDDEARVAAEGGGGLTAADIPLPGDDGLRWEDYIEYEPEAMELVGDNDMWWEENAEYDSTDSFDNLPSSAQMSEVVDKSVVEESALRSGGGGGGGGPGSVSKETPVSSYPSLSYGLQETHTTILPYVGWTTLALSVNGSLPQQLKIRLNAIWDMIDIQIQAAPAAGAAYPNPGFYNTKANRDGKTVLNGAYPQTMTAGTTSTERPQWRDYWANLYQYYTVLGVEYEIIHVNPLMDHDVANIVAASRVYPGEIIVAEQVDSYSDVAGSTGNVMPLADMHEVMGFKNIRWHKIGIDNQHTGTGTLIVKGRYTPGQAKRNIVNDGDVKTWTAVGTTLPTLKEFLTLNYWRHPLSPGTVFNANIQIRLKYIVQFKDLVSIARYPNTLLASTAIDQVISNIPANDDVGQRV